MEKAVFLKKEVIHDRRRKRRANIFIIDNDGRRRNQVKSRERRKEGRKEGRKEEKKKWKKEEKMEKATPECGGSN